MLSIPVFAEVNTEPIQQEFDFRQTRWGMTLNEVMKSETIKLQYQTEKQLGYFTELANRQCALMYFFNEDKLYMASYMFLQQHVNKNDYIDDYNTIKDLLMLKYGKPIGDGIEWKNNLYRDSKEEWGFAISIGHLIYYSIWENEKTKIMLGLTGDNFKITMALSYSEINFKTDTNSLYEKDLKNL